MRDIRIAAILVAVVVSLASAQPNAEQPASLSSKLQAKRSSPSDLELTGDLPRVPSGESRYLTHADLLSISRGMTIAPDDGNFKVATKVRAVPLENIALTLGIPSADMLIADCKDKYSAHYPRAYMAAHQPVLVTELNGAALSEKQDDDYGPYMIAHANFKPAFKILAHSDEPQIPWGVIRLEFRNEKAVLAAIAPRAGDAAVQDGSKIAQQNCFRCHNSGTEGGLKSGVSWTVLAALAANSPEFFTQYVRDPKSKNPRTQMAASPEYDDATMHALIAYFRTFAPEEAH